MGRLGLRMELFWLPVAILHSRLCCELAAGLVDQDGRCGPLLAWHARPFQLAVQTRPDVFSTACPPLAHFPQSDWLNFNRFTLRAEKTIPIGPLRCTAAAQPMWDVAWLHQALTSRTPRRPAVHAQAAHVSAVSPAAAAFRRAWVRGKGGMIVGDLPPYEAFPIGGTNSVRGYSEGAPACCGPL